MNTEMMLHLITGLYLVLVVSSLLKREMLFSLIAFFIVFIVKTVLLLQIIMCVKTKH